MGPTNRVCGCTLGLPCASCCDPGVPSLPIQRRGPGFPGSCLVIGGAFHGMSLPGPCNFVGGGMIGAVGSDAGGFGGGPGGIGGISVGPVQC